MNQTIRESVTVLPRLKRVIWCDGLFELVLGLLLATAMVTHLEVALPLHPAVIVGFGIVLLPVGLGLLALARSPNRPIALALALANAGGAVVFGAWLAWRWSDFTVTGQMLVAVTSLVLAVLAGLELVLSRAA